MRVAFVAVVVAAGCGRLDVDPVAVVPGSSPITYNATTSAVGDGVTDLDFAHTVSAAGSAMFAFVATRNPDLAPPLVMYITFGSQPFTKLEQQCPACGPNGINNLELWYLADPPVGTFTVSVVLDGNAAGASAIVSSYAGVSGLDQVASASGLSTAASVSWPIAANAWAVAGVMDQGGFSLGLAATAEQTARADTQCDVIQYQAATTADQSALATAGPVSFLWTIGAGSGMDCVVSSDTRSWIAIGASFL